MRKSVVQMVGVANAKEFQQIEIRIKIKLIILKNQLII